ncbi:uncharacterized protein LOC110689711 [Chenopodium quinoa]|nr:uncharacterized protein LOC110689711 [Chenopodium quinoa]
MMLIRSSSTPILGSLLSSYSESPNHGNHSEFTSPKLLPPKKFSFHQTPTCPLNLITPSSISNSSPSINAEITSDGSQTNGFRRVQSEGNLEELVCNSFDEFNRSIPAAKKLPRKPSCSILQSIPSFSMHNSKRRYEDDEEEESDEEVQEETRDDSSLDKTIAFMNMGLQERYLYAQEEIEMVPSKMHLARGLGVFTGGGGYNNGGRGSGGHNEYKPVGFGEDGSNKASMAEHYKNMVEENPGNPMILRNYAEFLHKSKDLRGAEEYYSRAILMDPGDGEILSQYAQLIWELHGDEERALSYFQRSVQASPENSHVIAAYANFLWETEEGNLCTMPATRHQSAMIAATT